MYTLWRAHYYDNRLTTYIIHISAADTTTLLESWQALWKDDKNPKTLSMVQNLHTKRSPQKPHPRATLLTPFALTWQNKFSILSGRTQVFLTESVVMRIDVNIVVYGCPPVYIRMHTKFSQSTHLNDSSARVNDPRVHFSCDWKWLHIKGTHLAELYGIQFGEFAKQERSG